MVVRQHANKLVVLMCKAKCCRPCKMFARKYSKIADYYSDALFFDIYGDESKETRQVGGCCWLRLLLGGWGGGWSCGGWGVWPGGCGVRCGLSGEVVGGVDRRDTIALAPALEAGLAHAAPPPHPTKSRASDMRTLPHAPPLQMMIRTGVKVTPFFALYRNGERVHGHGGVNEANLHKAIQANLLTGEAGFGSYTVAPAPKEEEEEDD